MIFLLNKCNIKWGIYKFLNLVVFFRLIIEYHFIMCAGHGTNSVGDKPTTGSYRQV